MPVNQPMRLLTVFPVVFLALFFTSCATRGEIYGGDPWLRGEAVLSDGDRTLAVTYGGRRFTGSVQVEVKSGYSDASSHVVADGGDWMDCTFRNSGLASVGEEWLGGCQRQDGVTLWLHVGDHIHT